MGRIVSRSSFEALYGVAYALKFRSKKEKGMDYIVPPMEGLWWVENMEEFTTESKSAWDWTMMIMQPEWISQEMLEEAAWQVEKAKDLLALPKLRLAAYHDGLSVQILHVG